MLHKTLNSFFLDYQEWIYTYFFQSLFRQKNVNGKIWITQLHKCAYFLNEYFIKAPFNLITPLSVFGVNSLSAWKVLTWQVFITLSSKNTLKVISFLLCIACFMSPHRLLLSGLIQVQVWALVRPFQNTHLLLVREKPFLSKNIQAQLNQHKERGKSVLRCAENNSKRYNKSISAKDLFVYRLVVY